MTCQGGQLRVREFQLRSGCPACRYIPGAVQLPFSLSGLGSTTRIRVSVGLDSEWIQLRRSASSTALKWAVTDSAYNATGPWKSLPYSKS